MGMFGKLLVGVVTATVVAKWSASNRKQSEERRALEQAELARKQAEELRRLNTPCYFVDGFTEEQFKQMVYKIAKSLRRINKLSVDGPIVKGTVLSQSGLSEWEFEFDFNNYGHVTGEVWSVIENSESSTPMVFRDRIIDGIHEMLRNPQPQMLGQSLVSNEVVIVPQVNNNQRKLSFCPYCGASISYTGAKFCTSCGKNLLEVFW